MGREAMGMLLFCLVLIVSAALLLSLRDGAVWLIGRLKGRMK